MATSWTAWSNAVFDAVVASVGSGVTVFWGNLGAEPMPVKPCLMLTWPARDIGGGSLGRGANDELQTTTTAGTYKRAHHRQHVLAMDLYSNSVFGDDHACGKLSAVLRKLQTEAVLQPLRLAGVKLLSSETMQDLSALLDTRAESRAHLDLRLSTVDSTSEAIGWIQTAEVDATVTVDQGTVP